MKILAMDELMPGIGMEDIQPHLEEDARHAWRLYEKGIFREHYFRGDRPGVVVIYNFME